MTTRTQDDGGVDGGVVGGPTVRRMQVGARLRRLRESRGVTRERAGYVIRGSESKISRMELGRVGFKERDIADLLTLYEAGDAERAELMAMAKQANNPAWWQPYGDLLNTSFQTYLDLEAAAQLIRTYEVQFVPGLLQTEAYARAVIRLGFADAGKVETERRVELRMTRQQLLTRASPPRLWAVIDEAVLHRLVGGPDVMRQQIEELIKISTLPSVRLQIIPFRAGGHAAAGGAFTILRFPEQDLLDVVYIEHLTGALYLEKREDVDGYAAAVGRLFIEADPPERTPQLLQEALDRLNAAG